MYIVHVRLGPILSDTYCPCNAVWYRTEFMIIFDAAKMYEM